MTHYLAADWKRLHSPSTVINITATNHTQLRIIPLPKRNQILINLRKEINHYLHRGSGLHLRANPSLKDVDLSRRFSFWLMVSYLFY